MDKLHRLIYTSVIAADFNPSAISQLLRAARSNNLGLAVTGLLIFDGLRFCQYLEGASNHVHTLAQRIGRDARHLQFAVKEQGQLPGPRRFPEWSMGYALASGSDGLEGFNQLTGQSAFALLEAVLPSLELEP